MESCPACTASLVRNAKPHCESKTCGWVKCAKCKCVIEPDNAAYFRHGTIWGNANGYLKATDA